MHAEDVDGILAAWDSSRAIESAFDQHGLSAATTMGKMRIAMGALAPHATGPGALLADLDRFAARNDGIEGIRQLRRPRASATISSVTL